MYDQPDMGTEECSGCNRDFSDTSNVFNIQQSGYCNRCDKEDKE